MVDDHAVSLEFMLSVPIESVWHAWTNPSLILKWFGSDPKGRVLSADVCVGGSFDIVFQDADQTQHNCYGLYRHVNFPHTLVFTWMWRSEPGVESLVTINLSENGESTKMFFQHEHVGAASKHNYQEGWLSTFMKLENVLTERALK